ncbi:MAG: GFA family protein [Litorimonas sp.]
MTDHSGQCLCGAVTYEAKGLKSDVHACHCDMCRRFTGSAFIGVDFESLDDSGPTHWFQSSEWAERGSCGDCGSSLFWRTLDGSHLSVAVGSLDDASTLGPIALHYFHDKKPGAYGYSDTGRRLSSAETVALFTGGEASE